MNCPKCKGDNKHKAGVVNGRQRYKCKSCRFYYTVTMKSTGVSRDIKRLGIEMYLAGIGFNSIARILKVSHVTAQQWVNGYEIIKGLKSVTPVKIIGFDDLTAELSPKGRDNYGGILVHELCSGNISSYWVPGEQKEVRNFGKKNRIKNK